MYEVEGQWVKKQCVEFETYDCISWPDFKFFTKSLFLWTVHQLKIIIIERLLSTLEVMEKYNHTSFLYGLLVYWLGI